MTANEAGRMRRRSITKPQRETIWGAELLSICQTITEDGKLLDDEIRALSDWLEVNKFVDLPAKDSLLDVLQHVLADGRITPVERKEVHRAIEAVLPPDLRELAAASRRAVDAEQRKERHARIQEAKSEAAARRLRRRPLSKWDFMVAGVVHEGRAAVVDTFAKVGATVYLARDPDNRFSKNAVEVRLSNGMQIGYVPEEIAGVIAPDLDAGRRHNAFLKKIWPGVRAPYPVVIACLYDDDADLPDLVLQADVPAKVDAPRSVVENWKWSRAADTNTPDGEGGCLALAVAGLLAASGSTFVWFVL